MFPASRVRRGDQKCIAPQLSKSFGPIENSSGQNRPWTSAEVQNVYDRKKQRFHREVGIL